MAKKKKKRKSPPLKPAAARKAPRKVAPAAVAGRRKPGAGVRAEMFLANWAERMGLSDYAGRQWGQLAVLAAGLCVLLLFAFSAGGYFVVRRGYGELIILWLIVVGLLFDLQQRGRMPRLGRIELGLFAGYTAWIGLSVFWSVAPARSLDEFVRSILYLSGFGLFYLYLARREWLGWIGHLFVAIVAVVAIDALLGKTFPEVITHPDPFQSNRLNYPLTYWNTMAVLMIMGFVIGIRVLADRATNMITRSLYAPALFLFLVALWFTFSRAGLMLLGASLGLYLLLAQTRLRAVMQTALLGLWTASVLAISYIFLPNMVAAVPDEVLKVTEGRQLALAILLFMAIAAASQFVIRRFEYRIVVPEELGRKIGYVLAGALALVAVMSVLGFTSTGGRGGPFTFFQNQLADFTATGEGGVDNPSGRLFSLQSLRFKEYEVSVDSFAERPLTGSGAGTWERAWLKNRPLLVGEDGNTQVPQVRDGHSWFFETMAELGLPGSLLLIGFAGMFIFVSIKDIRFLGKGRDREIYGAFFTACSAFLVHSMIDWDWEMPVITLVFFLFAGGLLRFGLLVRTERDREPASEPAGEPGAGARRSGWRRFAGWNWILGYLCVLAMVATLLPLVAATRVQAGNALAQQKDFKGVEKEARTAQALNPLDAEAYVLEALARQGQGDVGAAEELLLVALEKEPENDKTYRNLTRIYLQQYESARQRGDAAAMQAYVDRAEEAIITSRQLNPLEPRETGELEVQVRNIGGDVPPYGGV